MTIFTFGYGNRTSHNQLIKYFQSREIKYLIDVRFTPYGWSSLWHCTELEKVCKNNGVQYISKKDLGNTSGKPEWVPPDKKRASIALQDVAKLCKDYNIILMCSELDVKRCHRKEIAERLERMVDEIVIHLS